MRAIGKEPIQKRLKIMRMKSSVSSAAAELRKK
jgi:hypothetical protein